MGSIYRAGALPRPSHAPGINLAHVNGALLSEHGDRTHAAPRVNHLGDRFSSIINEHFDYRSVKKHLKRKRRPGPLLREWNGAARNVEDPLCHAQHHRIPSLAAMNEQSVRFRRRRLEFDLDLEFIPAKAIERLHGIREFKALDRDRVVSE